MKRLVLVLAALFLVPLRGVAADASSTYADWKQVSLFYILTTPEGAALPAGATVEQFPILLRLHRDFFDFRQARPHGEDLRFSTASGGPLAYHIEHWDAKNGEASVWVRIPKIEGNARHAVRMHWSNPAANSESDGRAVFNDSNGFSSVLHLGDTVRDETGLLEIKDTGTTATAGVIGGARRFEGNRGVFGGEKIGGLPTGSASHSSSCWFKADRPNATLLGWGNEQAQGKVVMQFRSPPHVNMDCYFSDGNVSSESLLTMGEWTHVVHTYERGAARIYVNGALDGTVKSSGSPLNIRTPARFWLGGWYHNYNFTGDMDEVRISHVNRSAEWIRLEYENQKPWQTLVGPLVRQGGDEELSVTPAQVTVGEGKRTTITARADGAQKLTWILKRDGRESIVAVDRLNVAFEAGRVTGPGSASLLLKAVYPDAVRTKEVALAISDDIPEPSFTLEGPATWDGRKTIELIPRVTNLEAMQSAGAGTLNYAWNIDGLAAIRQVEPGKLILKRAMNSGTLSVTAVIDNGGGKVMRTVKIDVKEPSPSAEAWQSRPIASTDHPEDNQFIAREGRGDQRTGTLVYAGTLAEAADSVFVRVFADDKPFATRSQTVNAQKTYSLDVKLNAGLVRYRTEFGSRTGDRETILHSAANIVCGDVYVIIGQSNAVATDFGKVDPPEPSDWVRTFGATDGSPQGSRLKLWANAQARSPGGKSEIGYWGLELGRRLVEQEKLPVCIVNGAVGGTRIDQHQRNTADPTDASSIYGRLLWRVQQARLTHGVRAILWHQGENDQGADGPTGGFGWETYRSYFIDLAGAWKEDYPNVQQFYVFQIWPKSCAMGIRGSDNRLRDVQRRLPADFSNLSVMSTLGVKPPGGCHFPAAGYAEFARLIQPLIEYQIYHRAIPGPVTPPNLTRASYSSGDRKQIVLQFDQNVVWNESLASQFFLDGEPKHVVQGVASGSQLVLTLKEPSQARRITYLDSAAWSPDNLLYGQNGLAALTFCDVEIEQ